MSQNLRSQVLRQGLPQAATPVAQTAIQRGISCNLPELSCFLRSQEARQLLPQPAIPKPHPATGVTGLCHAACGSREHASRQALTPPSTGCTQRVSCNQRYRACHAACGSGEHAARQALTHPARNPYLSVDAHPTNTKTPRCHAGCGKGEQPSRQRPDAERRPVSCRMLPLIPTATHQPESHPRQLTGRRSYNPPVPRQSACC